MNYFELFQLPISASIDPTFLSEKYIVLQKKYHPDFFTNHNEADKENAEEYSAIINKAYTTFKSKDKTLEYFLELKGIIDPNEKYVLPTDFLMDMMELNEIIESQENEVSQKIDKAINDINRELEEILWKEKKAPLSESDLQKLKEIYYKKKYIKRILDRLMD